MKTARIYVSCAVIATALLVSGCLSRRRFNNWNWQLDSLAFYTGRIDSLLKQQNQEISRLRIDFYTKTSELSEKIEMLNSRISDSESHLTRISAKLGSQQKAESEDLSGISPEARLIYESSYLNYVKGNYDEAIKGFTSYLQVAPDSPLSDNALYWIGESYAAMGKNQDAVDNFRDLIEKYPESTKRPTALYKIAIIYEQAGDSKTAARYYQQIIKDYPNAPEATLARDKVR